MSERPLRISYDGFQVPSSDCNDPGIEFTKRGIEDHCHVIVTVTDRRGRTPSTEEPDTYSLRFDRKVNDFELSVKQEVPAGEFFNSQEAINWFIGHSQSAAQIKEIIRVMGTTLPASGVRQADPVKRAKNATVSLVIANYIVTGHVSFPTSRGSKSTLDLAAILLDVYANTDRASVEDFMGKLVLFRGDSKLAQMDPKAPARASFVVSILDKVPAYIKFLQTLLPEETLRYLDVEQEPSKTHIATLESFVARALIDIGTGKPFRFDQETYEAFEAYREIHRSNPKAKDFCNALEEAVGATDQRNSHLGRYFVSECRQGLALSQMKPKRAAKESIALYLNSPRGGADIEAAIKKEVRKSKMSPDWLAQRGQIEKVVDALLDNIIIIPQMRTMSGPVKPDTSEAPKVLVGLKVELDAQGLKNDIETLIKKERSSKHREPLMASLGVMRLLLGKKGENKTIRLFFDGEFKEVPLVVKEPDTRKGEGPVIPGLMKKMERDLGLSFVRSDIAWPIGQGIVGTAGATTLGLGLGLKEAPRPVRQGLFTGGCTAVGMTLGSLVQHSKRAKNKHIWGAVGGAIGGVVGGLACGLVATQTQLFGPQEGPDRPDPPDPGDKNPVDEYDFEP